MNKTNPSILFVNPSLGTPKYTDEDRLRSYLSLGTLASALKNRSFLKRFAERLGRQEIIFDSDRDYPFASDSLELFWQAAGSAEENRNRLIYILSGYGCPHDCIFCAQRSLHGQSIRERSAYNIFKEIGQLAAGGFRKFAFVQETFLNRKTRVDKFCRLIENSGLKIESTAEARADQLDYGQLQRMQSAGLRFIQIGVESGDPRLLDNLGKHIDLDQIITLRNWCCNLKINTAFYLLVGLPGQDWQSVLRSALFIMDHPPYNRITKQAAVSIAIPYPGTRMWQAQTVRLVDSEQTKQSWPPRNPDVIVNDAGEFVGRNFTETDEMTSQEILEAWIYLDDFCHFLLHALDPDQKDRADRKKSLDYADRMIYMIQRRTMRDLIIRAQSNLTAASRKAAYDDLIQCDGAAEKHFKDIAATSQAAFDVLARFLAAVKFNNGFETMRRLSIGNRIKWMKICAMVWHLTGREKDDIRFEADYPKCGLDLDRRLRLLDEFKLNRCLAPIDGGASAASPAEIRVADQKISAFGFGFSVAQERTFAIHLI